MTKPPSTAEKIYSLPIRRPVTTSMVFLTMVVFGWKSYQELSINLMPDISYPTLTVRTEFEGAAPEDVEELLTRPLEETLSTVAGMVEISSVSSPGLSEVVLEFTWDTDMNTAQQDVRDRLDLFTPPREVTEKPVILRYDPTLDPVMRIAITAGEPPGGTNEESRERRMRDQLTRIRETAERHIKSDLEGELGIAQVLVKGGREKEIQVLLDSDRLKDLGISPAMVVSALDQQNISLSGGTLKDGQSEYLVRTVNEFETVEEIRETVIPSASRQRIRLREVATVTEGLKDRDTLVHINGHEAVELAIFKWGDANTVEVCDRLKDLLGFERKRTFGERFSKALARGMERAQRRQAGEDAELHDLELAKTIQGRLKSEGAEMTIISDQSSFILDAINEVKSSAITGGFLALLILFFFLRKLKTTLIIGVSIPISIVATFVPMFMRDISLNIMSLGGIALGVGMLVDDSIIVLESIFRCIEEGDSTVDAADRGTREVFAADAASTFTTIAVFLPIAFVEGVAGQLFGDLALTVTFSLLASLAVALYLIPMLAAREGVPLLKGESVVWVLAAYRQARASGRGRIASVLLGIPFVYAPRFVKRWLAELIRSSFEPVRALWAACRSKEGNRFRRMARRGLILWVPVQVVMLALLLAIQVAVKTAATIAITFLFLMGLGVAIIWWGISFVFRIVLWLPLKIFDVCFNSFREGYVLFLRSVLPLGPAILLLTLGLALHAGWLATSLGRELIPPMKQGEFGIRVEVPPGTRLDQTALIASDIEEVARAMPEIGTVAFEVGQEDIKGSGERGENVAEFTINLADPGEAVRIQEEVMNTLRDRVQQVVSPEVEVAITLPTLFSFKTAVELQIRGDDTLVLKEIGERVLERIDGIEGLEDAELSVRQGYPEIIITLDRDLLAERGISPNDVANRLRTEVQGDLATRFNRGGRKIDIRVRADRARLNGIEELRALSISDGYPPIPLGSVAEIVVRDGPSEVKRVAQREVATISANVTGRDLGAVSDEIVKRIEGISKPKDYQFELSGQQRELRTSYQSMRFALFLAIFLVYVVMACQFESLHQPALVMFSVPLAFIGVIYVLYCLNISVSVIVFIGGIVLAGIVVNDAIILVDYINQLRQRGMEKREAVVQAGRVRLRPIIMTTLTTVLGLLPMALQSGEGAEIRKPMAITVIAGLSSATILTLVIIPVVYDLLGGRGPSGARSKP